jgi:hypothetical protein
MNFTAPGGVAELLEDGIAPIATDPDKRDGNYSKG